jgi:6-phosphogluconolactonase (cycloisomerase 2 family)
VKRTPSTVLYLESLEERAVPSASFGGSHATIVYTETNNPEQGQNAILAFRQDALTGQLTQIGSFATGGTGQLNLPKIVGPDDGDQQVQATADGRFLYAVNEGSGSITAFRIQRNGGLERIGTFASGGDQPDSIGIAGHFLYVANRGDDAAGQTATTAPGVRGFRIDPNGSLTPISEASVDFAVGTFATQTLVSRDNRFLFVETATLSGASGGNTVNTFRIGDDGSLIAAPGGPASAGTNAPLLLGAAANPRFNIVYAGFTSSSQVGVFTYDETGRTTFVNTATDAGTAPCWSVVSADGRYLYVSNTASNSIGVYSLADPLHPAQIQNLVLAGPHGNATTGQANSFEIALDPTGHSLFAITQSSNPAFPQGNQLHTLQVSSNGTLSEPDAPILLSTAGVPANAHPQGVEVVQLGGGKGRGLGDDAPSYIDWWFQHGGWKQFDFGD